MFKDGLLDAIEPGQTKGLARAFVKVFRNIVSFFGNYPLLPLLGGNPRRRQAPQLLGTDGDQCFPSEQFQDLFVLVVAPIVSAIDTKQTSATELHDFGKAQNDESIIEMQKRFVANFSPRKNPSIPIMIRLVRPIHGNTDIFRLFLA